MESTQGVICLQYVLVLGESLICFILATKCLTMDVAPNLQLVCSFSCIMVMQWVFFFVWLVGLLVLVFCFSLFVLSFSYFSVGYFQELEIKRGRFQYSLVLPPIISRKCVESL